jgi:hypothetical protein
MTAAHLHPTPLSPVLDGFRRAPLGELGRSELTSEHRAELDQAMADIAAGRVKLIPHAEVQSKLEEMRRRQIDCADCDGDDEACAHCEGSGALCKACGRPWPTCVDLRACDPAPVSPG